MIEALPNIPATSVQKANNILVFFSCITKYFFMVNLKLLFSASKSKYCPDSTPSAPMASEKLLIISIFFLFSILKLFNDKILKA